MVIIGADLHKRSHTVIVVDEHGRRGLAVSSTTGDREWDVLRVSPVREIDCVIDRERRERAIGAQEDAQAKRLLAGRELARSHSTQGSERITSRIHLPIGSVRAQVGRGHWHPQLRVLAWVTGAA